MLRYGCTACLMLTGGKVASTLQELWSGLLAVVLRRTGKTNNFLKPFISFNVRCVDRLIHSIVRAFVLHDS